MHRAAMLFLCLTAVAFPLSKSYDVVPYRNCIGLQEDGEAGVSQFYRNTLDSLTAVSVWIGDTFDGGAYKVEVKDSVTDQLLAHSAELSAPQMWAWTQFPLSRDADPVRGRTYKVVVTRPTGAAISFAYCDTNPIAV